MRFDEIYKGLNEEQREAVDQIDGPLLVIAGPGTGKTQLLGARVANILKKTDTNPENILCLTYTDNGARNMRDRLNSFIGQDSYKVTISTYHGFGSEIISMYQKFSDGAWRELDKPIDSIAQYKVLSEIQKGLKHNDILRKASVGDLNGAIGELKSAELSPEDIRKIVEFNLSEAEKINDSVGKLLDDVPKGARFNVAVDFYEKVCEELAKFISNKPILGKVEREANIYYATLYEVMTSEREKEKPSTGVLTKWRNKYFEKDKNNRWVLANTIANKKLLSLANVMEKYQSVLEAKGWYDFGDMILEAIKMLESDDAFRYTCQERYQYILLDEYQDTNDAQARIVRLLTDHSEGRPNVMAVGDDDQAIFAFQGARYSNLMDFAGFYTDTRIINLTNNYRSSSEILDISRNIAEGIGDRFSKTYALIKKILFARKAPTEKCVERREFLSAAAENNWVAERIDALVKSGVPGSEIAVIAPKYKYIGALLPHLLERDVKVAYKKRDDIFGEESIEQILLIAKLVVGLANGKNMGHLWLQVLGFEFWKLSSVDIVSEMEKARTEKSDVNLTLLKSENDEIRKIVKFLNDLSLKIATSPLEILVNLITGISELEDYKSPYLEYYLNENENFAYDVVTNLTVLRDTLSERGDEKLKLEDLLEMASDYETAGEVLLNQSPYSESDAAVQIMTAHGSKGLEFEYVFIIATDNMNWGTSSGNNNKLTLPRNLEYVRHTGIDEDEKRRLFFVAITRAKSHLYMTNAVSDFAGKRPARLSFLAEYEDGNDIISPYLPEESHKVVRDASEAVDVATLERNWIGRYAPKDADMRALLQHRVDNYRLSPTDLISFVDVVYAGPEKFYRDKILRAPSESSVVLNYGNLIHDAFDYATKNNASDDEVVEHYKQAVLEGEGEMDEKDYLLDKGVDNLKVYLRERGDMLRAENAKSEVGFFSDSIHIDDVLLTGKIDHIEVDKKAKTIAVYDFKTGGHKDKKWDSEHTLHKYKLQLEFYKLLLENSREYRGYTVTKGYIEFVTPDDGGEVHSKELLFDDAGMEYLKKLAGAVYARVKAFDFPDTSGYSADLKGILRFEEDLLGS